MLNSLFFMSYRRSYYRGRTSKFSNETICVSAVATDTISAGAQFPVTENPNPNAGEISKGLLVVPSTNLLGNRKVKNFTVKVNVTGNESTLLGALVYVPEGTTPSDIMSQNASQSLYEPNQNVIMTFIIPPSCDRDPNGICISNFTPPSVTVSNRLARNLSSGDAIVMLFSPINDINAGNGETTNAAGQANDPLVLTATVNFAIKY